MKVLNFNKQKAIWYPFFTRESSLIITGGFMLTLVLLVLFLPNNSAGEFSKVIVNMVVHIPDINYQSSQSKFSFVIALVYLIVLFFSPLLAVILCLTEIETSRLENMRRIRPKALWKRVTVILGAIIFYLLPFFLVLDFKDHQTTKGFYFAVVNYRIVFLFYFEIIFLLYLALWLYVLDELTLLTGFLMRK